MTVIKVNAITVPADTGDELANRFAARAGAVDNADGFEGFELLKPTDGRELWLVLTCWRKPPTVSHHLKIFVDAGVLKPEQRGKWAYYRLYLRP
jgi:heme-degrading monooxygenase HmoA